MANVVSIVLLAALAAAYRRGVNKLWRRGFGAVAPAWRMLAFTTGLASLVVVQLPAVDAMAHRSLTGHMAQHMILLLLAGPLLAAGAPVLALANPGAHAAEHASFVAAAWLLWSLVLGRKPHRLAGPVAFLLLFATMMPTSALAAVLTFAPTTLYEVQGLVRGGDPLIDQQTAGLVMWIPMDVVVLAIGTAVFLRWLRRLERAMPSSPDVEPQDRVVPLEEIKP